MAPMSEQRIRRYLPDLRAYLVEAARARRLVGYKELADVVGTSHRSVGDVLDVLGREEHEQQRPILPAIVVLKQKRKPSSGFYRLLALLQHTSAEEDTAAWEAERDRVWAFDWPDER